MCGIGESLAMNVTRACADECAMGPVPASLRRLARVLLSLV